MELLQIGGNEVFGIALPENLFPTLTMLGLRMLGALLVWIVGSWIIGMIASLFKKSMVKQQVDPTLQSFLNAIIKNVLKVVLVLSVLGTLGIQMTSFLVILSSAGLAVGLALSGSLQNFAGGVMIILFKPFKVGDFISAQGHMGTVNEIQIFSSILKTPDNKTIIIPNGALSTSSLVNFSVEPKRRVDWTFGIAYGDNVEKAKSVIKQLCDADERIHTDPAVFMAVSELADSSVNIVVRAWVNAPNYWGVFFKMNEAVYVKFAEEGINIPFPQMDVHLHKD